MDPNRCQHPLGYGHLDVFRKRRSHFEHQPRLDRPGAQDPFASELQESPTDETSGIVLSGTQLTEIEYPVQATPSATIGAVYCFRLTDAGSPTSFTYTETTYGKVTLA